ncbi:MAG: peptidase S41, partial [Bacteroidales bacterium]
QILKDKIIAEKSNDLMTYKQEIIRALKMYIVPLYYYQKGRIQASLDDDNEVKKAIEILNNPEKYQKILQGPK